MKRLALIGLLIARCTYTSPLLQIEQDLSAYMPGQPIPALCSGYRYDTWMDYFYCEIKGQNAYRSVYVYGQRTTITYLSVYLKAPIQVGDIESVYGLHSTYRQGWFYREWQWGNGLSALSMAKIGRGGLLSPVICLRWQAKPQ